jgi:3-deoxy-D-manno-octulosonic-acid transferase
MAFRLAEGLFSEHVYYPWDVPRIVERALDTLRPKAYIVLETEIWPSMLSALVRRSIPAFLVNGRFSERTARNIRRFSSFWRSVYDSFDLLLVRSRTDRELLSGLGISGGKIRVTGDCKVDALLLRRERADLAALGPFFRVGSEKPRLSESCPLFLAGSTHQGEEEMVFEAFRRVQRTFPSGRLVIAPRHPERGQAVLELAKQVAPSTLFSALQGEGSSGKRREWTICVVDRIGLLFELYGVADAAFIGGSLVDKGGQNILEPASFGIPFSHGPFMRDFVDAARDLGEAGASVTVRNADDIAAGWEAAMRGDVRERAKKGAAAYFRTVGGAAGVSLDEINGVMPL